MHQFPGTLDTGGMPFAPTHWTVVFLSAKNGAAPQNGADDALASLCQAYWPPLYTFVRRRGYGQADAQDLTQDFFVAITRGRLLQIADPQRGRFRSLLLVALQNFLADRVSARTTLKRGGHLTFLSWENWMRSSIDLPIPHGAIDVWPDDRLFDAGWAASVAAEALRQLRVDYESTGRREIFAVLSPHLTDDRTDISYVALGARLSVTTDVVKRLLRQVRVRYRAHIRAEVAATVLNAGDVEDELRYLCAALSAGGR